MVTCKKRIIAFLIVALFSSSTISVCSAQSIADESTKPLFEKSTSLFANDPNFSAGSGSSLSRRELFYKMMLAVLLVVILGAAAIYISKKFVPRITSLSGKKIQVIETVHIGQRKAIHLIKIGEQMLLVGSTNESITKLADITDFPGETDLSSKEINAKQGI